jgi:hypothetical protein
VCLLVCVLFWLCDSSHSTVTTLTPDTLAPASPFAPTSTFTRDTALPQPLQTSVSVFVCERERLSTRTQTQARARAHTHTHKHTHTSQASHTSNIPDRERESARAREREAHTHTSTHTTTCTRHHTKGCMGASRERAFGNETAGGLVWGLGFMF